MKVLVTQLCPTLQPHGSLCIWNSPGKNTGVGSHFLSRGSSWSRDQTQDSCIAGRFLTVWATREASSKFISFLFDQILLFTHLSICSYFQRTFKLHFHSFANLSVKSFVFFKLTCSSFKCSFNLWLYLNIVYDEFWHSEDFHFIALFCVLFIHLFLIEG